MPESPSELAAGMNAASHFVSVIVPVRNEDAHVGDTLQQLLRQHYDPASFEVIVVDGESSDGTRQVVRALQEQHANLLLYRNPRRLSSAARWLPSFAIIRRAPGTESRAMAKPNPKGYANPVNMTRKVLKHVKPD